jgi:hypothetical protein
VVHLPVNHHLRPLYRGLAGLCGAYVLAFGMVGIVKTSGLDLFAQDGLPSALGLRANRAFAALSIVAGLVLIGGAVVGRNIDRWINLVGGMLFLVSGFVMMVLLQTNLNILGFTMATCIASFLIGMTLATAGLYGQVGPHAQEVREERFRHGVGPDPEEHILGAENVPRSQQH